MRYTNYLQQLLWEFHVLYQKAFAANEHSTCFEENWKKKRVTSTYVSQATFARLLRLLGEIRWRGWGGIRKENKESLPHIFFIPLGGTRNSFPHWKRFWLYTLATVNTDFYFVYFRSVSFLGCWSLCFSLLSLRSLPLIRRYFFGIRVITVVCENIGAIFQWNPQM